MSGPIFPHSLPDHACGAPGLAAAGAALADFDTVELQILDLVRLLLSRRTGHLPRHAALPEDVARHCFGPEAAPRLLGGTARMIEAMAQARGDTFHYTNPYCRGCARGITAEETHLLEVLHHQRRGHRGQAMVCALMICEARPIDQLIETSAELAILTKLLAQPAVPTH